MLRHRLDELRGTGSGAVPLERHLDKLRVFISPKIRPNNRIPDPLLSADEERLFREISPGVRVQTLSNWLEDRR